MSSIKTLNKLIAIIGWGSLIWEPKSLNYNKSLGWINNGPLLPVEFARISNDNRLTLVITESGTLVKTFYTLANINTTFEDAIENLQIREGCNIKNIGYYRAETNEFHPEDFLFKNEIKEWSIKTKIKN